MLLLPQDSPPATHRRRHLTPKELSLVLKRSRHLRRHRWPLMLTLASLASNRALRYIGLIDRSGQDPHDKTIPTSDLLSSGAGGGGVLQHLALTVLPLVAMPALFYALHALLRYGVSVLKFTPWPAADDDAGPGPVGGAAGMGGVGSPEEPSCPGAARASTAATAMPSSGVGGSSGGKANATAFSVYGNSSSRALAWLGDLSRTLLSGRALLVTVSCQYTCLAIWWLLKILAGAGVGGGAQDASLETAALHLGNLILQPGRLAAWLVCVLRRRFAGLLDDTCAAGELLAGAPPGPVTADPALDMRRLLRPYLRAVRGLLQPCMPAMHALLWPAGRLLQPCIPVVRWLLQPAARSFFRLLRRARGGLLQLPLRLLLPRLVYWSCLAVLLLLLLDAAWRGLAWAWTLLRGSRWGRRRRGRGRKQEGRRWSAGQQLQHNGGQQQQLQHAAPRAPLLSYAPGVGVGAAGVDAGAGADPCPLLGRLLGLLAVCSAPVALLHGYKGPLTVLLAIMQV